MSTKETLNQHVESLNNKIQSDEKYRKKLGNVKKSFCMIFDNTDAYNFSLEDGRISEIRDGRIDSDITIELSSDTFQGLLSKQIDPLAAYFDKRIRVKASLMDKLLITEIFK